jgi:hypothetical protein
VTIDLISGNVYLNGRLVGKIHYPFEENGQRVRRSTWKLVMGGRAVGTFPTFDAAQVAAQDWRPSDEIDRRIAQ